MTFIYWSNKTKWHDAQLFECEAENLPEADALFTKFTGIDPAKTSWVSIQTFGTKSRGFAT